MTSQSNNFTGYSHFSRKDVFRKLGLTIIEPDEPVVEPQKPEPTPIFEEVVEEVAPEPVVEEPVVEEPLEQPTQEEVTVPEVEDTVEEVAEEETKTPIETLDLKKTWIKALTASGINTVEDLASFFESGNVFL